ncbi:MAG: alpha/beta hydrolase [Alcanivoracaceae bacterium]|nr:alpha/beta hydrolase [Alcanivoracaceae bacterium]
MSDPIMLTADDGHAIAIYHWPATAPARGVVHWLHGMAEHGARYARLAEALNAAGWHLVAHDHRGHGASVAEEADRGHYADDNGWEKVIGDTAAVVGWINARLPDMPVVMAGHSMGSFIALDMAERHGDNFLGLVLCGSNYHSGLFYRVMRLPALIERWRLGGRGISKLIHSLSFGAFAKKIPDAATEFDWLSRDPEEVAKYMADPWCGHDCTVQMWIDLINALIRMHRGRNMARLPASLPVLLIAGDSDPMSNFGRGVPALFRKLHKAGVKTLSLCEYAGGRHEILNDRCRDEVTEDLLEWLQALPTEAVPEPATASKATA